MMVLPGGILRASLPVDLANISRPRTGMRVVRRRCTGMTNANAG